MTEGKPSHVKYLDTKILKELAHEIATQLFQEDEPMGLYDDHDPAKLDSCIHLPRQSVFGQELYPDIYRKAAVTFYAFNRNHAFGNGNKRMSVAATAIFLYINDLAIDVSTQEFRDIALWLAQVDEPIDTVVAHLAEWIRAKTIPISAQ